MIIKILVCVGIVFQYPQCVMIRTIQYVSISPTNKHDVNSAEQGSHRPTLSLYTSLIVGLEGDIELGNFNKLSKHSTNRIIF